MDNKVEKKKKIKSSVGWGVKAYEIIMKNKIVIDCCLLVQGLFYTFRPGGSLLWDAKIFAILTAAYSLSCAIVIITNRNEKAIAGNELATGAYKGYWDDKQKQMTGSTTAKKLVSENELLRLRSETADARAKAFQEKTEERRESILLRNKWILTTAYLAMFVACIPLFFYSGFTAHVMHVVLGFVMVIEGSFTFLTLLKTGKTVKHKDRAVTFIISALSIALGILLIALPSNTAEVVIKIVGIGLILKAVADIIVMIHNRSLIMNGKETIDEIKSISPKADSESDEKTSS